MTGNLDSARVDLILENVLQSMTETQYFVVTVDISAATVIDSLTANDLLKMSKAIGLMGGA